jgi:glycosyltransferase involved in cell wall biosynthesis
VHVNLTDQGDGLGTLFALSFLRRQMVATLHLIIPERARVKEVVSRAALRIPKLLICVSGANGAYAREAAANAVVIPNGVPAPSLAPDARAQLGLRDDAFVVGGIGRIDPQKGWDVLCRATPAILEQVPNAEFVVVGGGDAAWLEGVPGLENVRFVGPRENAAALLGAFDLLAMPSRYEGLGLVALEALAAGVPVVASAIRGLGDALADCGVQIEPERPDLLADVIVRLAKDDVERERLALAGSARQSAHFTEERMVEETRDAYVSVRRSR